MLKSLKLAAAMAALALLSTPVLAQAPMAEWVEVSNDAKKGEVDSLDTASIKHDGSKVRFMVKTEFEADSEGWETSVMDIEFNCDRRKLRLWAVHVVYTDGRKVSDPGPDEWFDIPEGSLADKVHPRVCLAK